MLVAVVKCLFLETGISSYIAKIDDDRRFTKETEPAAGATRRGFEASFEFVVFFSFLLYFVNVSKFAQFSDQHSRKIEEISSSSILLENGSNISLHFLR